MLVTGLIWNIVQYFDTSVTLLLKHYLFYHSESWCQISGNWWPEAVGDRLHSSEGLDARESLKKKPAGSNLLMCLKAW